MNNYIVTHTFKSKEAKEAFAKAGEGISEEEQIQSMTGENAACQMSWETPGDSLTMFCYWKAKSPDDVNTCLLYTSPSPRDAHESRMPSSA